MKKPTAVPTTKREPVVGGVKGASTRGERQTALVDAPASDSSGPLSNVVIALLGLAIVCFAVGAVRWAAVPSRVAYYVVPRQVDLTILGLLLLIAAGFTILLTRGP